MRWNGTATTLAAYILLAIPATADDQFITACRELNIPEGKPLSFLHGYCTGYLNGLAVATYNFHDSTPGAGGRLKSRLDPLCRRQSNGLV